MIMQNKRLAIAVAGVIGLGASTAQAVDFGASATLENTLSVTVVNDMDLGTLFATATGAALANGVGALIIAPDGGATPHGTDSTTIELVSLGAPTGAQGSVDMSSNFNLELPNTVLTLPADFATDTSSSLVTITDGTGNSTELVHESANPAVPSLYLTHFTVSDVSGGVAGTETATFDGGFPIVQNFGETTYVFNVGATVTTKPVSTGAETYQAGVYSGTFVVTAAY